MLMRLDAGAHFLIQDAAKGTVNLVNGAGEVRRSGGEVRQERPPGRRNAISEGGDVGCACRAAVPVEGAGDGGIESPLLKDQVVANSTVHIYTVPLTGEAAKARRLWRPVRRRGGSRCDRSR
jgi:hypothetical protein